MLTRVARLPEPFTARQSCNPHHIVCELKLTKIISQAGLGQSLPANARSATFLMHVLTSRTGYCCPMAPDALKHRLHKAGVAPQLWVAPCPWFGILRQKKTSIGFRRFSASKPAPCTLSRGTTRPGPHSAAKAPCEQQISDTAFSCCWTEPDHCITHHSANSIAKLKWSSTSIKTVLQNATSHASPALLDSPHTKPGNAGGLSPLQSLGRPR